MRDVLGSNPQNANLDPASFQDHVVPAQSRHLGFGIQNIAVNEWRLVVVYVVGHVFLAKVEVMVAQAADVVADRVVSSSKAGQVVQILAAMGVSSQRGPLQAVAGISHDDVVCPPLGLFRLNCAGYPTKTVRGIVVARCLVVSWQQVAVGVT